MSGVSEGNDCSRMSEFEKRVKYLYRGDTRQFTLNAAVCSARDGAWTISKHYAITRPHAQYPKYLFRWMRMYHDLLQMYRRNISLLWD